MTDSLGQWPSAPLVYVLAEVRCSPTLDIEKRAAAVQEIIGAEFPLLEPISEVRVGAGTATSSTMYAFADATRRRGVVITPNSMCYHATEYTTSQDFFERLGRLLRSVESVYARDTVTRLGLRYVDAIVPNSGESVFAYVSPTMTGISLDGDGDQRKVQCVVEQPRVNGGITVRLLALGVPLYRSPDLPAFGLHPPAWIEGVIQRRAATAILDTDHWITDERRFEAEATLQAFKALKPAITTAFLKTTTEHAIQIWKQPRGNV